jgi:RNA polymerase sigma factor (sigma-70 family)
MNTNDKNPATLLTKLKQGDKNVFSEIEEMFFPLIRSLVGKYASDTDEGEAMQEARLALYNSAMSYDLSQSEVSFGLYAKICITNALVSDARKRKKKQNAVFSLDEIDQSGEYLFEEEYDPSKHMIENEDAESLYKKVVLELSKYEADVFDLHIKSFTTAQIAAALNKNEKSVSNALCRMTAKLRSLLK